jgi:hypothetical protein
MDSSAIGEALPDMFSLLLPAVIVLTIPLPAPLVTLMLMLLLLPMPLLKLDGEEEGAGDEAEADRDHDGLRLWAVWLRGLLWSVDGMSGRPQPSHWGRHSRHTVRPSCKINKL